MSDKHIFIFGLGYVGIHLAQALYSQGWKVTGTTRNPGKFDPALAQKWHILEFNDGTKITHLEHHLSHASHVITTISALSGHDPVLATHEAEIRAFTRWVGYVSATSVYPDQEVGFIDETVPPAPTTKRGKARLAAEQQWGQLCNAEILRVAGIYGPGRNAIEAVLDGKARIIEKKGQLFNRIHQTDITAIILAAIASPRPGRIINLCDEEPAPQGDVIRYASQLVGLAPPAPIPFEEADLTPMARSFYQSHRRLRSSVIGPELGLSLRYPTYREGLKSLLEQVQANRE